MSRPENWQCPFCYHDCILQETDIKRFQDTASLGKEHGHVLGNLEVIICPNPTCRKLTISANLFEYIPSRDEKGPLMYHWDLAPETISKTFPDYIPGQLRDDYLEAYLIKDKSPRASATLARRCLQGIIRDFWGIKRNRLVDEIVALEEKIDDQTWAAIDAVLKVGDIGAHMEEDVNLIIDAAPKEPSLLLWLIEALFEGWYVERHQKEKKMRAIIEMAQVEKEEPVE